MHLVSVDSVLTVRKGGCQASTVSICCVLEQGILSTLLQSIQLLYQYHAATHSYEML